MVAFDDNGAAGPAAVDEGGFSVVDATLRIGDKTVLESVSARFRSNRIYGLIGSNGSGKTSLIRMLARHRRPSAGTVRYGGRDVTDWSARGFAREVAYVPQQLPAGQQLTVSELVALGRYPWHGPFRRLGADDRKEIDAAIEVADLAHLRERMVDTLSGGERQRAWVAMMVAQAGRFLLLDEPTSALDIAHQAHLLELLRKIARERALGIVMAFHDINIAASFCDEVLAMRGGRLIAAGPPDEIIRAEILSDLYDIEMGTVPHPVTAAPIGFVL